MKKALVLLVSAILFSIGVSASFEKINSYEDNFSDVKPDAWFYENVKTAYELGFMNGKSQTLFDPNGNVTVAEGVALASRLHASYNGAEITEKEMASYEYRFDFDDPKILVDLTKRNSRNDNGINFHRAVGEVKDGMIVFKPDAPNDRGSFDPGLKFEGLDIDTKIYNKITFRMKRDKLDNVNPNAKRNETVEIYFETSSDRSINEAKCVKADLNDIEDLSEWFIVEVDMTKNAKYTDILRGMRFDPTNNNGVYYIDYIVFSNNGMNKVDNWYDMYADYAVDNGIIGKYTYSSADYKKNITRADMCKLFAASLPYEYYNIINDIKAIPDVDVNDINSDVYLMLYKAGVLLGSDEKGTFNGDSPIKRSEISAIINRAAIPENRVKGTLSGDSLTTGSEFDLDFEDDSENYTLDVATGEVVNGALVMKTIDRGENHKARFDPRIVVKDINLNADEYMKLRIRMKTDYEVPVESPTYDFYFMTEGDSNFSEAKSIHGVSGELFEDAAGWLIIEFDFRLARIWKGKVTAFRFDPANVEGTYTIDYLHFIKGDYYKDVTHGELIEAGYTATRLLQDEGFETGFQVSRIKNTASSLKLGYFQDYVEEKTQPLWNISPHWARFDLIDDRDTSLGKYTIGDKHGVNTITYNPDEKSLTMHVNTYPIYEGKPHIDEEYEWWPHLLVSQSSSHCPIDKERNSAAADRMFVEIDIRLLDFKDTTINEGSTSANFMSYFYLRTDKAPGDLIWFGLNFFNGNRVDGSYTCGWAPDSGAHQYMYKMHQAVVFDGVENSFVPEKDKVLVGEEWKHVRLDVTPHIEQAVEWANRDNIFGVPVTVEDMYFEGVNIGYETWGNYDYTVEFKNFNMVSYTKE